MVLRSSSPAQHAEGEVGGQLMVVAVREKKRGLRAARCGSCTNCVGTGNHSGRVLPAQPALTVGCLLGFVASRAPSLCADAACVGVRGQGNNRKACLLNQSPPTKPGKRRLKVVPL